MKTGPPARYKTPPTTSVLGDRRAFQHLVLPIGSYGLSTTVGRAAQPDKRAHVAPNTATKDTRLLGLETGSLVCEYESVRVCVCC